MPGKQVLLAEDDPQLRALVAECLREHGYAISEAEDGVRACESAVAEPPDLILLDLILPRRDGYTALLHLRSQHATRSTPVLFLSGEDAGTHEAIALRLGAQGFVQKPFESRSLLAKLEAALGASTP